MDDKKYFPSLILLITLRKLNLILIFPVQRSVYSCVSLLLLAANLLHEHMFRITIVRHVGKVHFLSDYDILEYDKVSFPKLDYMGGVCDR